MDILLLRFNAPLMSFGGVRVDHNNVSHEFPLRSMLAGLLGNAMGLERRDGEQLQALQARIRFAARQDIAGSRLVDYQVIDLGQDFLREGWTTRGEVEGRDGSEAARGTHIRYRHYLAGALYTLALTLRGAEEGPSLDTLEEALRAPARPLYIGRKCCLPASNIYLGRTDAPSLRDALRALPAARRRSQRGQEKMLAWWPPEETLPGETASGLVRVVPVFSDRDWQNQVHVGRSMIHEGMIEVRRG